MGKPTGFLEYARRDDLRRPPEERVREFRELAPLLRQQLELYRKELPAYNAAAGTAFFSFFRFKPREQF